MNAMVRTYRYSSSLKSPEQKSAYNNSFSLFRVLSSLPMRTCSIKIYQIGMCDMWFDFLKCFWVRLILIVRCVTGANKYYNTQKSTMMLMWMYRECLASRAVLIHQIQFLALKQQRIFALVHFAIPVLRIYVSTYRNSEKQSILQNIFIFCCDF